MGAYGLPIKETQSRYEAVSKTHDENVLQLNPVPKSDFRNHVAFNASYTGEASDEKDCSQ